jgi:hypothetical protein
VIKKKTLLLLGTLLLIMGVGITIFYLKLNSSRTITFAECTNAGGVAWRVDLYHPDICPSCAEYQACREKSSGDAEIADACPQINACSECRQSNFPYPDRCPAGKEKIGTISDAAIWFQCCKE